MNCKHALICSMASHLARYRSTRKKREEARTRIEALGEPFKMEILDAIKTEPITIYHVGDQWWDLCAGPHVETTGEMPHPPSSR